MKTRNQSRRGEAGNVLFLILIAVALFAALSYAVTQSTRSGGGDASSETNLVNSASLTQYPAGVRTSIVRMVIGGTDVTTLSFTTPSAFTADCTGGAQARCVFHPAGGGATYQQAPGSVMASGNPGQWYFNGEFEIVNIGTSSAGAPAGNDLIAFLPGITSSVCDKINDQLDINGGSAVVATADISGGASGDYDVNMEIGGAITGFPAGGETVLGTGGTAGTALLDGQPFGCFRNNSTGDYVYYHVLLER